MHVMLFSNLTYSSYTEITVNYNSYINLIGAMLYNVPKSKSTLKLLPLIFMGKLKSTASFLDVVSC